MKTSKQCQDQDKKEFHTMIKKEVQKCVTEAFQAQFATYCCDNKLNSDDDDDEQHQIESPLKLDLEDIKVSENYNLSDLRQPQTKCAKTHHLCPITTAFVDT
jgi:hypothetical protein